MTRAPRALAICRAKMDTPPVPWTSTVWPGATRPSVTMALQADPTQDATVDELVSLLTRLGRYHELLALLSARLEDAPADRREALLPKQRTILTELADRAEREGRADEAALFRMVCETLS